MTVEVEVRYPRRQATVDVYIEEIDEHLDFVRCRTGERVPVFVWPVPTRDGCFIVEHRDGRCQKVQPYDLTFLGSEELFDQYDWGEA